jgi:hypothetical protein
MFTVGLEVAMMVLNYFFAALWLLVIESASGWCSARWPCCCGDWYAAEVSRVPFSRHQENDQAMLTL